MRLPGYDYRDAGAYFVTICTWQRALLFEDPSVKQTLETAWQEVPKHFPHVALDTFVVMPNHLHGIPIIKRSVGAQHAGNLHEAPPGVGAGSLSAIVRSFKAAATKRLHEEGQLSGRIWQSSYYDHIVRNQHELDRIREYIALNPSHWQQDPDNPNGRPDAEYDRAWSWLEAALASLPR